MAGKKNPLRRSMIEDMRVRTLPPVTLSPAVPTNHPIGLGSQKSPPTRHLTRCRVSWTALHAARARR